jgi:hypothetical protein
VPNEKFEETKSNILSTGHTVAVLVMTILAVMPVNASKKWAKSNIEDINHGRLRTLIYLSRSEFYKSTFRQYI